MQGHKEQTHTHTHGTGTAVRQAIRQPGLLAHSDASAGQQLTVLDDRVVQGLTPRYLYLLTTTALYTAGAKASHSHTASRPAHAWVPELLSHGILVGPLAGCVLVALPVRLVATQAQSIRWAGFSVIPSEVRMDPLLMTTRIPVTLSTQRAMPRMPRVASAWSSKCMICWMQHVLS